MSTTRNGQPRSDRCRPARQRRTHDSSRAWTCCSERAQRWVSSRSPHLRCVFVPIGVVLGPHGARHRHAVAHRAPGAGHRGGARHPGRIRRHGAGRADTRHGAGCSLAASVESVITMAVLGGAMMFLLHRWALADRTRVSRSSRGCSPSRPRCPPLACPVTRRGRSNGWPPAWPISTMRGRSWRAPAVTAAIASQSPADAAAHRAVHGDRRPARRRRRVAAVRAGALRGASAASSCSDRSRLLGGGGRLHAVLAAAGGNGGRAFVDAAARARRPDRARRRRPLPASARAAAARSARAP